MKFDENTCLDKILHHLFIPYFKRVPDVIKIFNAMIKEGIINDTDEILNDHVAFRTLGVKYLGIQSLEKIFLHHGYTKMDHYHFESKKLDAYWYAPHHPKYPRVFISELRVEDLSHQTQKLLIKYTQDVKADPVEALNLEDADAVEAFFHQPLFSLPTSKEYQQLLNESEYAAWVLYNRYYLNHYTLSIHALKKGYNTLENFVLFLEKIGIKLNDAGGKIKVSRDKLLKQSSTVAEMVKAKFSDGSILSISGSYVEFAERRILPEYKQLPENQISPKHRREGFEASNADKIFESTYTEQIKKEKNK